MENRNYFVAAVFFVVGMIGLISFLRSDRFNNDIKIAISDSERELTLVAEFPHEYSEKVQAYVKSQLKMSDLSDFQYLEVKHYQTPDKRMRFHIKSREGYLKIVLDKKENSRKALRKVKELGEGLEDLFGEGAER